MQLFDVFFSTFCGQKFVFNFFAHKKPPQKVAYLWQLGGFFFSAAPPAQNSPELHFRSINLFIQPSLLESLVGIHLSPLSFGLDFIKLSNFYFDEAC